MYSAQEQLGRQLVKNPHSTHRAQPGVLSAIAWFRQLSRYVAEIMNETRPRILGSPVFPAELSCEIAVPMMDVELFGAQDDESVK